MLIMGICFEFYNYHVAILLYYGLSFLIYRCYDLLILWVTITILYDVIQYILIEWMQF